MRKEKKHSSLEHHRSELSRCVKCGACSAVCPTYLYERNESFTARGRVALIKAVLDGKLGISRVYLDRLATCTTCLACEVSCASGVPVTGIIQAAREQAMEAAGTGLVKTIIAGVLKRPALFRAAARLAPLALHYSGGREVSPEFRVRHALAPGTPYTRACTRERWVQARIAGCRQSSEKDGAKGAKKWRFRGRVVLFPGCAVEYFQPDLGTASMAVLNRLGYEVIVPEGLKCCGRPLLSLGDRNGAEELAAHNSALLAGLEADAVVTVCASCGLTFKKEYPKLLPPDAKRPVFLDIHEFLAAELADVRLTPLMKSVTVHDPCHLGRGQGLTKVVRDLLGRVPGLTLVEMDNADRCCGFGGAMRLTHRGLSDGIADAKAKNIIATGAPLVATGCPGCRMQIADALRRMGSDVAVLHPVQVLEQALEGAECTLHSRQAPVNAGHGRNLK
jgi:glycolate oxidase iron-sulfur subunit